MINVKKGNAHSLDQTSKILPIKDGEAATAAGPILAGQVVFQEAATETWTRTTQANPALFGFQAADQLRGDVIAAKKLNVYLKDGSSIISTDQTAQVITAANYPIGSNVYALADGSGKVTSAVNNYLLGTVEAIDTLPQTEDYQPNKGYARVNVLSIKLAQ